MIACVALLSPSQARGQILNIVNIFSAIESTITGLIGGALNDIQSFQTQVQTLYQEVIWPVASIAQAQSFISATIGSYRGWMNSVNNLPIASAQLTNPTQLESAILSQSVSSFPQMNAGYNGTYRNLPTAQQAPMHALQITDINDALAKDALAQSIASDQANESNAVSGQPDGERSGNGRSRVRSLSHRQCIDGHAPDAGLPVNADGFAPA